MIIAGGSGPHTPVHTLVDEGKVVENQNDQCVRSSQKEKKLNYIPLSMHNGNFMVELVEDDLHSQEDYWSIAIIRYVLGDTPYEKLMENYVVNVWKFVTKPCIIYHDDGYYQFQLNNIEYQDPVLHFGHYSYHNKPFILRN